MHPPDHVTGLAARGACELLLATLPPGGFALVICDVVGLKGVNDREGFLAGDACLRRAADRLRGAATGAELVARLGGDELVAVFRGPDAAARARRTARVLAASGSPAMRAAAAEAVAGEASGPLIERLYATMRRA